MIIVPYEGLAKNANRVNDAVLNRNLLANIEMLGSSELMPNVINLLTCT